VLNFGIKAAVSGMVPTKAFLFSSLDKTRHKVAIGCGPHLLADGTTQPATHRSVSALRIEMAFGMVPLKRLSASDLHGTIARGSQRSDGLVAGTYSFISFASDNTPVGNGPFSKFESRALK
jgi:hypothetical protein